MISITKGKNFERQCANLLTKKLGVKFQRVPCSGAMATSQEIQDPRFKGDLFTEDPHFKSFVIECKITKNAMKIDDLFVNKKPKITSLVSIAKSIIERNHFIYAIVHHNLPRGRNCE